MQLRRKYGTPRMTVEQLKETDAFKNLSPRQAMLVLTFLSNGYDKSHSVLCAYSVRDKAIARQSAFRLFNRPNVKRALDVYFGIVDPREKLLGEIEENLKLAAKGSANRCTPARPEAILAVRK